MFRVDNYDFLLESTALNQACGSIKIYFTLTRGAEENVDGSFFGLSVVVISAFRPE